MEAKWYVVHTLSGAEKKVKEMIIDKAEKQDMSQYFEEIVVPLVKVPEVKRGKMVTLEKKLMPGYILIKMILTDESWRLVKDVPKTSGFLGDQIRPHPISEKEVRDVFSKIESETQEITSSKLYDIGEQVMITDGPFDSFTGVVEEVDGDKQNLKVLVSIFGKATPINLSFTQVKKIV